MDWMLTNSDIHVSRQKLPKPVVGIHATARVSLQNALRNGELATANMKGATWAAELGDFSSSRVEETLLDSRFSEVCTL